MTMLAKFRAGTFHKVQLGSAIVGAGLSIYLLAQHTRLKSGIQGEASFCSLGRFADCDLVNSSQYSEIFGVPLASLGAVYFFGLLLLSLISSNSKPSFPTTQRWIVWLSTFGILMDSGLFLLQVFAIQSVCLFCLLTYVANTLVFLSAIRMFESKSLTWRSLIKKAFQPEKKKKQNQPSSFALAMSIIALSCFITALVLLPDSLRLRSKTYSMMDSALTRFFEGWKDKKNRTIDWRESDGKFGDPNSKVRLVTFSDFQCPYCRNAAFTLHNAVSPIKDKIFFVFKHFPLDQSCNVSMPYQLHPHACSLARLAYCANKKGVFWQFHDYVFMRMDKDALKNSWADIKKEFSSIFSEKEIDACLKSKSSLASIKKDIALAKKLKVSGTPTLFINGKHVSVPLTVETIRKLIAIEIGQQDPSKP